MAKIKPVKDEKLKEEFNEKALHPLQAWKWGEFRKKTGVRVLRWGVFEEGKLVEPIQITIHQLPVVPYTVGYLPKGYFPSERQVEVLEKVAKEENCIFIKVEPKVEKKEASEKEMGFLKRNFSKGRPLFAKYNFVLDVTRDKEDILMEMKSKTRYNVRYADRKGVKVSIDNSEEAFEEYIRLLRKTTERQGFYAHGEEYQRKMWEGLRESGVAQLIKAEYEGEVLVTWILFDFGDSVYYPYGVSSRKHRNLQASSRVMWESILYAKKEGKKYFDMWGALEPDPDKSDSWYGFHRFKEGFGARHVEYVGSYDYVAKPAMYKIFRAANAARWKVLRVLKS